MGFLGEGGGGGEKRDPDFFLRQKGQSRYKREANEASNNRTTSSPIKPVCSAGRAAQREHKGTEINVFILSSLLSFIFGYR